MWRSDSCGYLCHMPLRQLHEETLIRMHAEKVTHASHGIQNKNRLPASVLGLKSASHLNCQVLIKGNEIYLQDVWGLDRSQVELLFDPHSLSKELK